MDSGKISHEDILSPNSGHLCALIRDSWSGPAYRGHPEIKIIIMIQGYLRKGAVEATDILRPADTAPVATDFLEVIDD